MICQANFNFHSLDKMPFRAILRALRLELCQVSNSLAIIAKQIPGAVVLPDTDKERMVNIGYGSVGVAPTA